MDLSYIKFEDETLQQLFFEVVETCFYDKERLQWITEVKWVYRWTSIYNRSFGIIGIKKRKKNRAWVERDMIHEIMHEVYRRLKHGEMYELLEEKYINLLAAMRKGEYKEVKNLRNKIKQLESLLT